MNICHVGRGGGSNHKPFKSRTYRFLSLLHVLNRCRVCNLDQFHPLQAGFHTPNVKLVLDAHFAAGALADGGLNVFFSDVAGPVLPVFHRPGAETCGSSAPLCSRGICPSTNPPVITPHQSL